MKHLGIDVHQKYSEICELSEAGEVKLRRRIATTATALQRFFGRRKPRRVVMECGSLTPWVSRLLSSLGHEVIVVNPRRVRLIAESTLKSDEIDAEVLARLSRFDPELLGQVYQRSEGAQMLRSRLRVRSSLVKMRTSLINTVRGTLRAHGHRLGSCASQRFVERFSTLELKEELGEVLEPLVSTLGELTERIGVLDRQCAELSRSDELLTRFRGVPGVGPIVSLAYVSWMDRPERFARSRDVGACLGLRPRVRDSGDRSWRGSITHEGDQEMRRLLVQAAHAALHSRADFALKRWALGLSERIGKSKAVVALARKLAVVMHRMWVTGRSFEAFPGQV